jgi:hypothetical protein
VFGYMGPRFQELVQGATHFRHGRYMAYAAPRVLGRGRTLTAAGAFLDDGLRNAWKHYLRHALTKPTRPFPKLHVQSVMCIQPIDVLADGRTNMCDACPDITVHEGELVWSCRLEELLKFGGFARGLPKQAEARPAEEDPVHEPVGQT